MHLVAYRMSQSAVLHAELTGVLREAIAVLQDKNIKQYAPLAE